MQPRKLKRVVIREELVILLGNTPQAVLLGQLLYWHERTKDIDQYIEEEHHRMATNGINSVFSPTHGWIYKTAKELSEEVMLGVNETTIRNHLKSLVNKGYIAQRRNPKHKWDKTYQYRVNLIKVMSDLEELGFPLAGYELLQRTTKKTSKPNEKDTNPKDCESNDQKNDSNPVGDEAIPEIPSEVTLEVTLETSSTSNLTDEEEGLGNQVGQAFKNISDTYLKLARRKTLTSKDREAIMDVVNKNWPIDQVIQWIHECYQNFRRKHERDEIRSFSYIANYIFDQAASQYNTQEVILNGRTNFRNTIKHVAERNTGEVRSEANEYYRQYQKYHATDSDIDCDF